MMNKNWAIQDWLLEQDFPTTTQPDPTAMQAPTTDLSQSNMGQSPAEIPNQEPQQQMEPQQDITQDPAEPDMPEEQPQHDNFEVWRNNYLKESIKGDVNKLIDLLNPLMEKDLEDSQYKFVSDNWNICLLRMNSNIDKASKEIRRNILQQLDRNNPATSVVQYITDFLSQDLLLVNMFIKLKGYVGLKGELHRKLIGSLIGGVQVGSGANTEDVIFNDREYSILISTRFNAKWGDVVLGNWTLKEDDAQRYLSDPEIRRLEEGSPEEKDVLRRRIVVESIAKLFATRAFIINVVGDDGTLYTLGWDIATSLRAAYNEGKLIVKTRHSDNSEAMITDDGQIMPLIDLSIHFVKETGEQDEDGKPATENLDFLERRNGNLFLTATLDTIRNCSKQMQGIVLKENPFGGSPSELKTLLRCVYTAHDLLVKQC